MGILLFFSLLTIVGLTIISISLKLKLKKTRTSGPGAHYETPPTLSSYGQSDADNNNIIALDENIAYSKTVTKDKGGSDSTYEVVN